jgi:hypothetical protein
MQYPEYPAHWHYVSPEWQALELAFEECLDADLIRRVSPLEPYIERLRAASDAVTTHWNDQWRQHNAIRNYLKSWDVTL